MIKYLMVRFVYLVSILWSISPTQARQGVDVSQLASTKIFSCLKQKGYDFVIVRAYRSIGKPDTNARANIQNARAANLNTVEAYMFPCPKCGISAQKQVDDMLSLNLGTNMIWLDIEISNWYADKTKNRQFFRELVNADFGQSRVGIYTNKRNWSKLMGLDFTEGSQYPLWYARYDGRASFSDFEAFGGWRSPQMKQFAGDKTVCGFGVDLNYMREFIFH